MVFDFIKKYFPIKTDSFDKFIEVVEKNGGVYVNAKPMLEEKVGRIATCEYSTLFQSKTQIGRLIIFDEVYGSRSGRPHDFDDLQDRELYALKGILTADKRLQVIKQRLPNIKTALVGPNGTMDKATHQKLYEYVKKYKVTPFRKKSVVKKSVRN